MARRTIKSDLSEPPQSHHHLQDYIIRIDPFHYLHVKDTNTNIVQVVTGPKTHTCLDHEKVVFGPEKMISIPPRHYLIVDNPVVKKKNTDESGKEVGIVVLDDHGQVLLRHGDKEVRFEQPPFPLYDGEKCGKVQPLRVVEENTALRLRAIRDFEDRYDHGKPRRAGAEWLFYGRATYYPQVEVEIVATVKATILKSTQALKVRAADDCVDYKGNDRKAGEEWLVKKEGTYLPRVNEEVVETVKAYTLTYKDALHIRAKSTFTDSAGIERKAGTEWLVSSKDTESYIPGVYEEVTKQVQLIVLGAHDYCIIKDPVDDNYKPQLGMRKIIRGHTTFFLKPGEHLESMQQSILLGPEDALWITATEEFYDKHGGHNVRRRTGHVWLCCGPGEYWTPLEAKVQMRTKAFLQIEPLGLYFFQPALFFGYILVLLGLLYFVNYYL